MKIDLHVHIKRTSRCARADIEDMAKAAIGVGLDGLVVLDHSYQSTKEECDRCMQKFPKIKLFRGAELCVFKDDLVLISANTMNFLPPYRQKFYDIDYLHEFSQSPHNLTILAHPYRRSDQISWDLNKFHPNAVEIASTHIVKENRLKINLLAEAYGMNTVAVSDAHKTKYLGGYCIETDCEVNNEVDLIKVIKNGLYTPMERRFRPVEII